MSAGFGVRRSGERAFLIDVDDTTPAAVASAVRTFAAAQSIGLSEVVPGAGTVLVVAADAGALTALLKALPELEVVPSVEASSSARIEIPVRYDGPDLPAVAAESGLLVDDVIRLHSAATYQAAFTGFAPGFAYLTGLDSALQLPRRSTPRSSVPAGSVAIADVYSAIYPRSSPGGWHLIGSTDAVLFDPERETPALIMPGALVTFVESRP